eukprot:1010319-Rhodomonas_salina.1
MQADQLQHVLECAREAPPTLEVKGTDAELGIVLDSDLPDPVTEYWMEQRRSGRLIPWSISHRLPARTRPIQSDRNRPELHPITAP